MERSDPAPAVVICDAGPLIHLDELGCLDLLSDFPRVIVPESVWREVETHRPQALVNRAVPLERRSVAKKKDPEIEALATVFLLQRGEADALRIMRECRSGLLLTDDTAARLAARGLGMQVHGTLGIVVRAIRRRQRTPAQVVGLLRAILDRSTLFVKRALLEGIIQQIEQQL